MQSFQQMSPGSSHLSQSGSKSPQKQVGARTPRCTDQLDFEIWKEGEELQRGVMEGLLPSLPGAAELPWRATMPQRERKGKGKREKKGEREEERKEKAGRQSESLLDVF